MAKVLIVDDEPDILLMLRVNLESEGYATALAADGETALRRIDEEHPDVMLLDVMMPVMDGWSVLEHLTGRDDAPRVVVLSAKTATRDMVRAVTLGADAIAFGGAGIAATRGRMLRSFSVRKEVKDHGAGGGVPGVLEPGDRVVLTDDAITRGAAFLEAAAAVRHAGADPELAVPVVDRGGTAAARCEADGIAFRALVTAPDLGFPYEGGD